MAGIMARANGGGLAQPRGGAAGTLATPRPVDPNAQKPLNTNDPGYQQVLASVVGKPFSQQTAAIEQWMKANHYYVPDDQHINFDAEGSDRGKLASGGSGFSWTKAAMALGAPFAGVGIASALGGGAGGAANGVEWGGASQGLTGGSVSMGVPNALPVALDAGPDVGAGVLPGLLGPSAETPADVAGAAGAAGGAAGGAAPAGSGSILSKLWPGLKTLSSVLTGAAKSGNDANLIQNQQNLGYDQAQLNQQKFALTAPGQRATDSIKASLASNFTPTKMNWGGPGSGLKGEVPTFSGGASGGMQNLDPATKGTLQQVLQDELASEKLGGAAGKGQDSRTAMPPPTQGSSTGDKILGGAGLTTAILSALFGGGGPTSSAMANVKKTAPTLTPQLPWTEDIA